MLEPQVQSRREIKQLPSKIRGESKRFSRLGLTSYGRLRRLVNVSPEDIYPSPQPPLSAVRTSGPRGGLAEGKGGGLGRLQGQSRLGLR